MLRWGNIYSSNYKTWHNEVAHLVGKKTIDEVKHYVSVFSVFLHTCRTLRCAWYLLEGLFPTPSTGYAARSVTLARIHRHTVVEKHTTNISEHRASSDCARRDCRSPSRR